MKSSSKYFNFLFTLKANNLKIMVLAFCVIVLFINTLKAQVKIGDNPATINSSSLLEMESKSQGFLMPRMTDTERNSIASPATGLQIFSTTTNRPNYFNGSSWVELPSATYGKHILLPTVGKGVGPTKTSTVVFDNNIVEQFSMNNELYFRTEIPDDYAGGIIYIHINFLSMSSETAKEVRWDVSYKSYVSGSIINGTTGTIDSGDKILSTVQYTDQLAHLGIPAIDITGRNFIMFKITRVSLVDGNNPSVNPAISGVLIHYTAKNL